MSRSSVRVRKTAYTTDTSQATGTSIAAASRPTSKVSVRKIVLGIGGSTAGTVTIWFSRHASTATTDTTFTAGTDDACAVLPFIPSASLAERIVLDFEECPWGPDDVGVPIRITTSAAVTFHCVVHYDEVG